MKESKNLNLSTVATHKNKQSRSNPCKPSLGMPSAMFAVCNQVMLTVHHGILLIRVKLFSGGREGMFDRRDAQDTV